MVLLKEYGIRTGDVPEDRIPETLKESFLQNRDSEDGRIKIGLDKSYQLLDSLGHSLGKTFMQSKRLSALLKQRNESFLAHGTKPISQEACRNLFDEIKLLLQKAIPDFDQICSELRFPWQKNKNESSKT